MSKKTAKKAKTPKAAKVAKKESKRGASVFVVGNGKAGHTLISATQLGQQLGVDPKRVRAWLRGPGVGNDGQYTRYAIDIDSKEGKSLVKRAAANFA